jgi:hypothetical protein
MSKIFEKEAFIDSFGSGSCRCADLYCRLQLLGSVLESLKTYCSAGKSLQLSFWAKISNCTLSGQSDGVALQAKQRGWRHECCHGHRWRKQN